MSVDIAPAFPGEPARASVRTAIPGPATEALRARALKYQDARSVHVYQDPTKSVGNYLVDVDGNELLDLYGHIAAIPIGFNHPDVVAAIREGRWAWALGFRAALGVAPPPQWVDGIEQLMRYAPKGHTRVFTVTTGADAVENAIKAAFVRHMKKRRGGASWTDEDARLAMLNRQPFTDKLKVISFESAFHGRSLGALSLTRSKPIHKLDFPAFDWPVVPFPANRFPLDQHAAENRASEARVLQIVADVIKAHEGEVAALIVEPIQGEGGDRHASPEFFVALRKLLREHDIAMIVDEVQTGCGATGRFWAHEAWGLDDPPEMVTFSKKMQIGGFFMREEMLPAEPFRIFNTWLGDPLRLAQLQLILDVIERDRLIEHTASVGNYLMSELHGLAGRHPDVVSDPRGLGTHAAIDIRDTKSRDRLVQLLRNNGAEVGGSGERSIRFRPALVLAKRHVDEAIEHYEAAIAKLSAS